MSRFSFQEIVHLSAIHVEDLGLYCTLNKLRFQESRSHCICNVMGFINRCSMQAYFIMTCRPVHSSRKPLQ